MYYVSSFHFPMLLLTAGHARHTFPVSKGGGSPHGTGSYCPAFSELGSHPQPPHIARSNRPRTPSFHPAPPTTACHLLILDNHPRLPETACTTPSTTHAPLSTTHAPPYQPPMGHTPQEMPYTTKPQPKPEPGLSWLWAL